MESKKKEIQMSLYTKLKQIQKYKKETHGYQREHEWGKSSGLMYTQYYI